MTRNKLGGIYIEKATWSDNLAIALASYFSGHLDRPDNDEDDPELGWGKWVLMKTDEALDLVLKEINENISNRP